MNSNGISLFRLPSVCLNAFGRFQLREVEVVINLQFIAIDGNKLHRHTSSSCWKTAGEDDFAYEPSIIERCSKDVAF